MSFQKTKLDPSLGQEIHKHLLKMGLETPTTSLLSMDNKSKINLIEQYTKSIYEILGYDLSDDSLINTPIRIAKMMVLETMWGLLTENFPKMTTIENKMRYDEMITVGDINIMSHCEHHGSVIDGRAWIAYIPDSKVIGLSKMSRVSEYFSRRAQVQERLTRQISETLKYILETDNVAVVIKATHYCMRCRGVEDLNAHTTTSALSGAFKDEFIVRNEFMNFINPYFN